jgi:hypothetical protein
LLAGLSAKERSQRPSVSKSSRPNAAALGGFFFLQEDLVCVAPVRLCFAFLHNVQDRGVCESLKGVRKRLRSRVALAGATGGGAHPNPSPLITVVGFRRVRGIVHRVRVHPYNRISKPSSSSSRYKSRALGHALQDAPAVAGRPGSGKREGIRGCLW